MVGGVVWTDKKRIMDEININDNGTTGMGLDYIMIPSNLPMYDVYQTILSNSDITDTEKEDILQIYKQLLKQEIEEMYEKDLLEAKTPLQKEKIDAKYKTKYNNNQEVYDTLTYDDSASNTYLGFGTSNNRLDVPLSTHTHCRKQLDRKIIKNTHISIDKLLKKQSSKKIKENKDFSVALNVLIKDNDKKNTQKKKKN